MLGIFDAQSTSEPFGHSSTVHSHQSECSLAHLQELGAQITEFPDNKEPWTPR